MTDYTSLTAAAAGSIGLVVFEEWRRNTFNVVLLCNEHVERWHYDESEDACRWSCRQPERGRLRYARSSAGTFNQRKREVTRDGRHGGH